MAPEVKQMFQLDIDHLYDSFVHKVAKHRLYMKPERMWKPSPKARSGPAPMPSAWG